MLFQGGGSVSARFVITVFDSGFDYLHYALRGLNEVTQNKTINLKKSHELLSSDLPGLNKRLINNLFTLL